MTEHDLILLATKHGSWFGNTLELRKEGLALLAAELEQKAYENGYAAGQQDYSDHLSEHEK